MAKKSKAVPTAASIATQLLDLRHELNLLRKDEKDLTDVLKKLIRSGEQQEVYYLRKDYTLAIADSEKAMLWASIHNCLKIDLPLVDKKLKAERSAVPPGFGLKETEKLVEVSAAKEKDENFIIEG